MMKPRILVSLLVFLVLVGVTGAATLQVPGATYPTIQSAIDAAVNGDEVVVADGIYSGVGNTNINFNGKAITVRSANGPENCIIDCNDAGNAFYFYSQETTSSVVDGFQVTGGNTGWGGAIDCYNNSSPTITNCIITGNLAYAGGGIDCFYSSPDIINCVIKNNEATYSGGGINCFESSPRIIDCNISGNIADYGGGLEINGGTADIKNCLVLSNTANYDGGGIDCMNSNPQITNCTIIGNSDSYGGGGVYADIGSAAVIKYCIFWSNEGDLDGTASADYSRIEDSNTGVGNINDDPLFTRGPLGDYYLNQKFAGQLVDSNCIDRGDVTAISLGLDVYTTRTDEVGDADMVDIGYHYPKSGGPVNFYDLDVSVVGEPNGHGYVDPNGILSYKQFSQVRLTATADIYYKIKQWTLDGNVVPLNPSNPDYPTDPNYPGEYIVTMDADRAVTVEFEEIGTYQLTTSVKGTHGSIDPNSGPQYEGHPVTITAYPDADYSVYEWYVNGSAVGVDPNDPNHHTILMDNDKTVSVEFVTNSPTSLLRVMVIGGHGTVGSGGINPFFGGMYNTLDVVSLTAHPDWGYQVSQWNGTDNDSIFDVNNQVTMTYNKDVTLSFEPITRYRLETGLADSNGDAIDFNDPNSDINGSISPSSGWQDRDSTVVVTATADWGYKVKQWWIDGNPVSSNTHDPNVYIVEMVTDRIVRAEFERRPWLNTDVNSGSGTISPNDGPYDIGDVVTITATPTYGYKVTGWTIDGFPVAVDPNNVDPNTLAVTTQVFIHNGDNNVAVDFAMRSVVTLTITDPDANGIIEPNGTTDGGVYYFYEDEIAIITAYPDLGHIVDYWIIDGNPVSNDPNHIFIIDPNLQVTEYHLVMNTDHTATVRFIGGVYIVGAGRYYTIQGAINAARNNDRIVVSDGTYTDGGNYNLHFDPHTRVILQSENGPEHCIIDCNWAGRGFIFGYTYDVSGFVDVNNYIDPNYIVDGFTITRGFANRGGALYYRGARFADNLEMAAPYPSPTVRNCIIINNFAFDVGGGVCFDGDDIQPYDDPDPPQPPDDGYPMSPFIRGCKINNNTAFDSGGGICSLEISPKVVTTEINNNFSGNFGGGVYMQGQNAEGGFINCILTNNNASNFGGGFYIYQAKPEIRICTIMYNNGYPKDGDRTGGIFCAQGASPEITSCIVGRSAGSGNWGHADSAGDDLYACDATFSCIENSDSEETNIHSNPQFVTGISGSFYLRQPPAEAATSPCVDAGSPTDLSNARRPVAQNGYGLRADITTNILNGRDFGNTDAGFHYVEGNINAIVQALLKPVSFSVIGGGWLEYHYIDFYGFEQHGWVGPDQTVVIQVVAGRNITLTAFPNHDHRVLRWTGTNQDKYWGSNRLDNVSINNSVSVFGDVTSGGRTVTLTFEESYERTINAIASGSNNPPYTFVGIQEAIFAARDGDTVLVHPGTYNPPSDPYGGFLVDGKDLIISSMNPEDPNIVASTIIDGAGLNDVSGFTLIGRIEGWVDNDNHVHLTHLGSSVLTGFTIQNFNMGILGLVQTDKAAGDDGFDSPSGYGLGIRVFGNHIVSNCVIKDCSLTTHSGNNGIKGKKNVDGGDGGDSGNVGGVGIYIGWGSPLIQNCKIMNCSVTSGNGGNGANGAGDFSGGGNGGVPGRAMGPGIYCGDDLWLWIGDIHWDDINDIAINARIEDCTITNCVATGGRGGDGGDAGSKASGGYGGLTLSDPAQDYPGNHSAHGGAVYCAGGSRVVLKNCKISDNTTVGSVSGQGGIGHPSNIQEDPQKNYHIPSFGGGVYCTEDSRTIFENCDIKNNETTYYDYDYTGYGGGICFEDVNSIRMTDCNIVENSAPIGGGAFALASNYSLIEDCNLSDNSSYIGGGLYVIESANVNISKCEINDNIASQAAKPIVIPEPDPNDPNYDPNDPNLPPSEPETGILFGAGGGLYCFSVDATISDCNISRNTSDGSGGGVYIGGHPESITPLGTTATPDLLNCLIAKNIAGRDGGGVSCNWYSQSSLTNCTLVHNKVTAVGFGTSYGGGLYVSYDSNCVVRDSIIWGNSSNNGAQIAVDTGDPNYPLSSDLDIMYSNIGPRYEPGEPIVVNPELTTLREAFDEFGLAANDDLSTDVVDIGFTINFFGKTFSRLYVNNNGNVTFNGPLWTFTPFGLTGDIGTPIIAPYFADVDTRVGNITRYGTGIVDGHPAFGVTWIDVGYYYTHVDKLNTFQ
ncbi:MAG: InlB B-repeat-containing protein, partial [Planctomycetota bacterium]